MPRPATDEEFYVCLFRKISHNQIAEFLVVIDQRFHGAFEISRFWLEALRPQSLQKGRERSFDQGRSLAEYIQDGLHGHVRAGSNVF